MPGFPVALGPVGYPLPAYADGGYPIFYLDLKDRVLCANCCNDPECEYGPAVLADIHYEGAPLDCDGCGEEIESAYGDPEAMPEEFFDAFIVCALWSSSDNADDSGGEPLDANYDSDDIAPETLAELRRDCEGFWESEQQAMQGLDVEQCGHDFWLDRNGHGAGFWDRGLGAKGERLSKASKVYGGVDLMVCSDGKIRSQR